MSASVALDTKYLAMKPGRYHLGLSCRKTPKMVAPNSLAARRAKYEQPPVNDDNDAIILSCRLKSGKYESSIEVPLYATKEEMNEFTLRWLSMMDAGIKIGQKNRKE